MFKQKTVGTLVLAGAVALAGFTGLAYGQNGKPTTTPTQVEVVNKTVLVGTATLHVVKDDLSAIWTTPVDVSAYSMVRVIIQRTVCVPDGPGGSTVWVNNIAPLDQFELNSVIQRVYDIPGETLTVGIALNYYNSPGTACDFTVALYGRRN